MTSTTAAQDILSKGRALTSTLRMQHGRMIGIACAAGKFAVTETTREGKKFRTTELTGLQSYIECVTYLQGMVEAMAA